MQVVERPELLDYVVFFETEPEWVDPRGWFYGARFMTQRGDDRIVATLAPDEMEFAVEWWQGGLLRLRFSAVLVDEWQIEATPHREVLRVGFNAGRLDGCELQLKPHVSVSWRMQW